MSLLVVFDLLGIFVFALSGATAAVENELDLFGVLVLSSVAAIGGGLLRDVLLGALPPAAFLDGRYLLVPIVAGLLVFVGSHYVERLAAPVRLFDAAGLGLFVAAGTTKALEAGLGPVAAIALGSITGIGGGIARDVLVGVVPVVLRRELYAIPTILGASVVVIGDGLGAPRTPTVVLCALLVFSVRMLGVWRDWHFPTARVSRPEL
ncbi:MAG: hypothetical protein JWN35_817 [Frankiales bacterium]|jgi:uncharacterized membrane protein YeiH|nr:hypothetical protein [Frankiales bacterium]